jgi:hypothetical protein
VLVDVCESFPYPFGVLVVLAANMFARQFAVESLYWWQLFLIEPKKRLANAGSILPQARTEVVAV